jgi:5-methylcytosine-specific restriction endonuclease McrA
VKNYSLSHLSDEALLHGLSALVAQDRTTTAAMLAHIAEVDERRLYLPAGYDSMFAYCVGELRLSEDAAAKRIQAARAARRFPAILVALARGRLHLTGVGLLAPHLTEETAEGLLAAATDKTKAEIERLIAARFPRPEVLAWVAPIPPASPARPTGQHAPAHVDDPHCSRDAEAQHAPGHVGDRPRVKPLSSQSYEVTYVMSQRAHDLLRTAQALLAHQIPSGDVAQVVERALELLVPHLQQRKFAATSNPRPSRGPRRNPRSIPAEVMRAVWARDQGRCTFVSETGHRCAATRRIEFDHILEVARGGEASVDGLRLRCRAHNQYQAERTFGAGFMRRKRRDAAETRAAASEQAAARRREREETAARDQAVVEQPHVQEVIPYLRALGCRIDEARRAAERCAEMSDASLEERVRRAVSCFGRGHKERPSPEHNGHIDASPSAP